MALPDRPSLEYLKKLAKDRLRRSAPRGPVRPPGRRPARGRARARLRELARAARRAGSSPRRLPSPIRRSSSSPRSAPGRRPPWIACSPAIPALANARDEEGSTPLTAAVDAHRAALIPLLLRHGGDPHLVYAHSAHTPLSWAVVIEAHDCARALMEAGVEPDLFCAAGLGEVERVRAFFAPDGRLRPRASITGSSRYAAGRHAAAVPARDRPRGRVGRALHGLPRRPRGHGARAARRAGPISRSGPSRARTALHWAYFAGAPRVVALLLAAGADPTLRDPVLGCTPEAFGICFPASVAWALEGPAAAGRGPARWWGRRARAAARCTRRRTRVPWRR